MLDCQFLFYVWLLPLWTKKNNLGKKLFGTYSININLVCFINIILVLFCFAGLWCDEISRRPSWRGWCLTFCNRYWIFGVLLTTPLKTSYKLVVFTLISSMSYVGLLFLWWLCLFFFCFLFQSWHRSWNSK
jgi:hypothetical protein